MVPRKVLGITHSSLPSGHTMHLPCPQVLSTLQSPTDAWGSSPTLVEDMGHGGEHKVEGSSELGGYSVLRMF